MSNQGYVLTRSLELHTAAILTANGEELDVQGFCSVTVQVVGLIGDTITFEVTMDGTNWAGLLVEQAVDGEWALTALANGIYNVQVDGVAKFRARLTRVGGSVTVFATASTHSCGMSRKIK